MTTVADTTVDDPTADEGAGRRPRGRRRGIAERAASFLERKVDRRGVLRRGAMVGTAMAVAPTTYALRPGSAYAAVCAPNALCNDGYTEFCCTIYGANRCPAGTALGGWWKVDGSSYCGGGPRYYMDCNANCGGCGCGGGGVCSGACTGTPCGCANGDCNNRKAGCTQFRYGQCNQAVKCLGPIVCRVVTCTEPWRIDGSCTTASRTDNATRYHSRPCLEVDAIGTLNSAIAVPGGVRVIGWALDPSAPGVSITVNVYDCLRPIGSFPAIYSRPDVAQTYPGQGDRHGFDAFFRLCPGDRLVSVAAVDTSGQGSNWIGHQTVHIDPNPVGHFDSVTGSPGTIRVTGFVIEPDGGPDPVDIYVDGTFVTRAVANLHRADIKFEYPHLTGDCGFDVVVPAGAGAHNVCIVARNSGAGADVDLGCRSVVVPADPVGVLESLTSPGSGSIRAVGWASDADTSGPIQVQLFVDGSVVSTFTANGARGDGHTGHGFDQTVTGIPSGVRSVCAVAVNVGGGGNKILGCNNLGVASVAVGQVTALDAVDGGVRVATTPVVRSDGEPASVRVLVDGQFKASLRSGPSGLDETLAVPPGVHEVAVTATVDGPRTIPIVLATASLDVPGPTPAPTTAALPGATTSTEAP